METDNHDATFSGAWGTSTARILYYGDDYRWALCSGSTGTVSATATFIARTSVDVSGNYSVFARWVVDPNRSTGARYDIYKDNGDVTPIATNVVKNQEVNGGEWRLLGTYAFTSGNQPKVILKNNCVSEADGANVIADAVRWVKESVNQYTIVDEPGIEYVSGSSKDVSTISSNCASLTNLASISVTAPASGFVHVQASGSYNSGTAYRWVRVGIDNASGGSTFDGMAPYIEGWTSASFEGELRFSLNKAYSVSAGANTFYLKACIEAGATGALIWDDFTATFYSTHY